MAPVRNGRVLFNSIPEGYPEPGKTTVYDGSQTIDVENIPLNGGFLVRTLVLSIDPYMRGKMRPADVKSYSPAFIIGEPLSGYGVGLVLRSECDGVKKGDHVYGVIPHQEYNIFPNMEGFRILENKHNLPWSVFVGAAGMPGQTAYMAWKEFAHPKKGETAFVTAAAGPVGSLVIQLAKRDGLKVIASAGSEEKVNFVKQLGADVAFNYKETATEDVLNKHGPVDIYWDNVGGPSLDAALKASALYGRFIMCGAISGYNCQPPPVYNVEKIFANSLSLNGFVVWRLEHKYLQQFYAEIPPMLASGELKHKEDVVRGLDKVGDMLLAVQQGKNRGKAVILVSEEK